MREKTIILNGSLFGELEILYETSLKNNRRYFQVNPKIWVQNRDVVDSLLESLITYSHKL